LPQQLDCSVIVVRLRQCALPLAHWRHLANTIKAVLPLAQLSPQPKWQVDHFSCFCTAHGSVVRHTGTTWQIQLNLCFLDPPESTIHTVNQLVQPFLHSSRQKVPILYNGGPFSPKLLLPTGSGPHQIYDSLGLSKPTTQTASPSVQPFLHR